MTTPREIEIFQNAKEASYLEGKLKPMFDELKEETIAKLKLDFRAENKSEVDLKVSIGVLCAIDDFENRIRSKINQAKGIERKMI